MTAHLRFLTLCFLGLLLPSGSLAGGDGDFANVTSNFLRKSTSADCEVLERRFPETVKAGGVVSGYTLQKCPGGGRFGEVWSVNNIESGDNAVIKFHLSLNHDLKEECLFARLAKEHAASQITDCLEVGTWSIDSGTKLPYAVFERANGNELLLDPPVNAPGQPQDLATVFDIMLSLSQLAAKLREPHHGIRLSHGDLRLANIFLASDDGANRVIAVDYGIKRICYEDGEDGERAKVAEIVSDIIAQAEVGENGEDCDSGITPKVARIELPGSIKPCGSDGHGLH